MGGRVPQGLRVCPTRLPGEVSKPACTDADATALHLRREQGARDLKQEELEDKKLTFALSISCRLIASWPSSAFRFCFLFCLSSDACIFASFAGEGGPSCRVRREGSANPTAAITYSTRPRQGNQCVEP